MKEIIFAGYGIELLLDNGRYFIRYDEGEIAVQLVEHEISEGEAKKAQQSERSAYEVILEVQKRS